MKSYVECLGGEGAGHGVASHCWNTRPDEERDELLPRKMAALQPKTEGSLRRRLLSAKIHQRHDAIVGLNAGGASRTGAPSSHKIPPPPHFQYPDHSPWYRQQHLPRQSNIHTSFTPEAHGKLFHAPEASVKPLPQAPPIQPPRSACPVLTQRSRTGSCPPTPAPRRGYTLPVPSPLIASPSFSELEAPPQYTYRPSRRGWTSLFSLRPRRGRKSGTNATQNTPLLQNGNARNSG